ncbi:MAG: hypothetical protein JWM89_2601 [Acidimicrobiales bacterium]|nr:hypothetical protein [Acidimicrobiales bacterium]
MHAPRSAHRFPTAALVTSLFLALALGACGASGGSDAGATTTSDNATTTTGSGGAETTTTDDPISTTTSGDTTTSGGSDGGTDRAAYVAAVVGNLGGGVFATDDQASCLANEWLDQLGLDEMQAAGVTAEDFGSGDGDKLKVLDLDDSDAAGLFDAYGTCHVDLKEIFSKFGSDGKPATAKQKACVAKLLTEDAMRESFVNDFFDRPMEHDPIDEVDTCFA